MWGVGDLPRGIAFWAAALDYRLREPATADRRAATYSNARHIARKVRRYFFFTPNFSPLIVADFVVTLYTSRSTLFMSRL